MQARVPLAAVLATAALGATAVPALAPRAVVTAPSPHLPLTGTVAPHTLVVRARSPLTLQLVARPALRLGLFSYLLPSPDGRLVAVVSIRDDAPPSVRFVDVRR